MRTLRDKASAAPKGLFASFPPTPLDTQCGVAQTLLWKDATAATLHSQKDFRHQHTIPIDRGFCATDVHRRLVILRQRFGISRQTRFSNGRVNRSHRSRSQRRSDVGINLGIIMLTQVRRHLYAIATVFPIVGCDKATRPTLMV